MRRVIVLGAATGGALGLGACGGGGSSGASSPNDALAQFASDIESGNFTGACSLAPPSDQAACASEFQKENGKLTFKNISYSITSSGSNTAQGRFKFTACQQGDCVT